jgi:DNA polymerase I
MNRAFFDIETNGFDLGNTEVHCICAMLDNKEDTVYNFLGEDNVRQFKEWLLSEGVREIVGHNIIGFDIPVMFLVGGFQWDFAVRDTLVLSRLANPSLDGGHSLRNWGNKLGNFKDDYEGGWEEFNIDMLKYCQQDVRVTKAVHKRLSMQLRDVDEQAINLEHEVFRIIKKQEENGMLINEVKAYELMAELKERVLEIVEKVQNVFTPLPTWVSLNELKNPKRKDGSNSVAYQKQLDRGGHTNEDGDWGYIDYPAFNLGSRQQVARYLQHFGWKPKVFTDKGNIIVDEKVLKNVDIPEAQLILEYFTISKRLAMVKSWIEAIDEADGRVHGRVNSCGAVTGRMTHSKPNLAQVPASYSPYGKECRELWTVPKGKKLVGMDASGLELRMLAHYMDDKDYTEEILNGDIHTANQMAAGLQSRDTAKTFIYAFLYGAGDGKIGDVVGGTAKDGANLKATFLDNTPSLRALREKVNRGSKRGWLRGLDGRKLWIRSPHLALNTLLQSAGAIVMKQALILLEKYAIIYNIDFKFVLNVHDEIQAEVKEDQAEYFGRLAVSCMQRAGQDFNLNCRLDGEYQVGDTWEETH